MEFVEPLRTQEELDAMNYYFKSRSERDYLLYYMGINVAFRISDLLGLKVGDVRNRDKIRRREMKTGKLREMVVLPKLKRVLDDYCMDKEDEEYLFKSTRYKNSNRPITRTQAYRILKTGAKECGIKNIGTHSFRKTFGYHFYKESKCLKSKKVAYCHQRKNVLNKNEKQDRSIYLHKKGSNHHFE